VHRDYSYSGSILISIFDDRIEFVTIGGLVRGITKEDMLLGVSMLRNKYLANIFYRLKLIEAFGTGIPKIMESYQSFDIQPKIEITDNAFKITLYNTLVYKEKKESTPSIALLFTEGEQQILDMFLSTEIIRRQDVEKQLNISQPMAIKYLKKLVEKQVIVKVGNGKNTRYILK
jgi:ATP-dependent DNA helicase RecG